MDISRITDYLYIGGLPHPEDAEALHALNIRLIISMCGDIGPAKVLTQPPFRLLWLRTFDTPFTPVPIKLLMAGVQAALPIIDEGGCVFTHCARGRHRSVVMGAAVLIAMGYSAHEAMKLIRIHREAADPQIWYIQRRIKKFEKEWHRHSAMPGMQ